MQNMLDRIITHKQKEVENAKANLPLSEIEVQARMATAPRGFASAIQRSLSQGNHALIAEIKKASPSKGLIRDHFDPASLAMAYENGGATCISVLTDVAFFQGHPIYLKEVRTASGLPVLRKDFMIDTYQVVEARAWGADCILVIMAAVDDSTAHALVNMAHKWGMDVLVEVHNRQELERALKLNTLLIGINNRNLQTFDIRLEVTEGLAPLIPNDRIVISESGIFSHDDLERLSRVGVRTSLVGECLMRQENVELATRQLLGLDVSAGATAPYDEDKDMGPAEALDPQGKPEAPRAPSFPPEPLHKSPEHIKGGQEPQKRQPSSEEPADFVDDFQAAVQELGALIGSSEDALSDQDTAASEGGHPPKQEARLSHVNDAGEAHMVDVSGKSETTRVAVAEGFVHMKPETLAHIQQNTMKKGDVLAAARIAGIMAAKNTATIIPLCHPLALSSVEIEFTPTAQPEAGVRVEARVKVNGPTGVEMEALTAVSVACLTIYDMAKAVEKGMRFSGIRLLEKTGGKSGVYRAARSV